MIKTPILLIDDERHFHGLLKDIMVDHPVDFFFQDNPLSGIEYLKMHPEIKFVLLDWNMGLYTALPFIPQLKDMGIKTIIFSSNNSETDQIRALTDGACDYITKNSNMELLKAKLMTFINNHLQPKKYNLYGLNPETYAFVYKGNHIKLLPKEYKILETLIKYPEEAHNQEKLNKICNGDDVHVTKRSIDTYVAMIRKKTDKDLLITIPKKGYQINIKALIDEILD